MDLESVTHTSSVEANIALFRSVFRGRVHRVDAKAQAARQRSLRHE